MKGVIIFLLASQLGAYTYAKKITINHLKVPATVTDFPVYVTTTDDNLKLYPTGHIRNANGYDLKFFTNPSCTTPLSWEPESYDGTAGTWVGWVKVPSVSHTADTDFYVCYGDAAINTPQWTAGAAWDSGYQGVYHLADGTTLQTFDSVQLLGNGVDHGGVAATSGKLDGAGTFSGAYLSLGNTGIHYTNLTVEAWVNPASSAANKMIMSKGYDGSNTEWQLAITDASYHVGWSTYNGSTVGVATSVAALTQNVWSHVVGTYDGTNWKLYINGDIDSTVAGAGPTSTVKEMEMGAVATGVNGSQPWDGKLDEIKISNVARDADWIKTEYDNQNDPATFLTFGAEGSPTIIFSPATFHNPVVF